MHEMVIMNRQVFLFHVFVCIFRLEGAQNTPFFEKITNQIFRLNYGQLICKPVRSKNKRLRFVTVNSTSIGTMIALAFFITSPSVDLIDLFGLYILFSQYRSCDNTQEVWSFVLFIKMRACKREYACMHSF